MGTRKKPHYLTEYRYSVCLGAIQCIVSRNFGPATLRKSFEPTQGFAKHRLRRVMPDPLLGSGAEAHPEALASGKAIEGHPQCGRIAGLHEQRVDSVSSYLCDAFEAAGEAGEPFLHGFQERLRASTLVERRQDKEVAAAQQPAYIRTKSTEMDAAI